MEIWRDCKGYEGLYQVSNMGRVWSVLSQKYLTGCKTAYGYLFIHIKAKNGKYKYEYIHRLVALTFLDNPQHLPQVNHKNEIKTDNRVENLEWCSAEYNMNYGSVKYIKAKKVKCYDYQTKEIREYNSLTEASEDTGVSISMISLCCNGKRKQKRYKWEFTEVE